MSNQPPNNEKIWSGVDENLAIKKVEESQGCYYGNNDKMRSESGGTMPTKHDPSPFTNTKSK